MGDPAAQTEPAPRLGDMGLFHDINELIATLIWPGVVVGAIIGFRTSIRGLLSSLSSLRVGNVSGEFTRQGNQVAESVKESLPAVEPGAPDDGRVDLREYFSDRFETNPLNVILESFLAVESWLNGVMKTNGLDSHDGFRKRSVQEMVELGVSHGLFSPASVDQVRGLAIMRDLAAHSGGEKTTPDQAREFALLTEGVIYSLSTELKKHDGTAQAPS